MQKAVFRVQLRNGTDWIVKRPEGTNASAVEPTKDSAIARAHRLAKAERKRKAVTTQVEVYSDAGKLETTQTYAV